MNSDKIAITGHTSPMGKDVYEHYSKHISV